MMNPPIHGWLAIKETSHTQPKHPVRREQGSRNKNMANWRKETEQNWDHLLSSET